MASKKSKIDARELFIHLRVHSAYSLLEGAIKIPDLIDLSINNKMPAVAITDRTNLFGSLEFSLSAAKQGLQPIIGCSINLEDEEGELALLVKDKTGYQNLLKIVSESFRISVDSHNPIVPMELLEQHADGLIALTGGINGVIGSPLVKSQQKEAEKRLLHLKEIFPNCLYVELQRHDLDAQKQIEQDLIDLAYKHEIPLIATNDVYFADRDMFKAHDALICISDGCYVAQDNRRHFTPEHYFKTAEEMIELFSDIPEAVSNTIVVAKRCAAMSEARDPMLPDFPTEAGRTQEEELRTVALAGLEKKLADHVYKNDMSTKEKEEIAAPYFSRLEYELDVIISMKFPGYFLIVSDFIRWSKENNVPVGPGRGSGAGSVVAWVLLITDLDPLRFGLLFERFLNPERVSMPDFDIDFCQERRDEVIHYVQQKYGEDKVAQIITFGKLQARAVLRDVGRVLQMSYNQVDEICKLIPFNALQPVTLAEAIEMDPQLQRARDNDEQVATLIDFGLKLEGLYRHASTHAAGVVIADRTLHELVPVYYDQRSDMPVTGYSMKMAETSGLVKFDFLGLKTLTVIDRACQLIRDSGGEINLEHTGYDDAITFEMLSAGDSTGVFQMESSGMRDALRKMKPDCIEDIIALISLYRPGPMENIPTYIARKHGKEKPDYLHPKLEETLKETFGVIIYQEQVMKIAQVLAGYSLGGADLLRRAMGKKIKAEMDAQRAMFVDGAVENNVDKKKASSIFDLVAKFAGYGFNKSHAAAYAVIGYHTAYLKANYPVEFLTACMNIDIGDTDKIDMFRIEAQRSGIKILPPDINKSGAYFQPENLENPEPGERKRGIRYAFGALKNVGVVAMESLVEERKENGPFKGVFDIASRCDNKVINKRQIENMVKSGVFDSIWQNRKQLFEAANILTRYNQTAIAERESNQSNLFGGLADSDSIPLPILPKVEDWEDEERLACECAAIGFYLTAHPLDKYKKDLEILGITACNNLEDDIAKKGASLNIAGVVTSINHRAANGRRFAYIQLSDPTTNVEVSIFNDSLINDARDLLDGNKPLMINVEARKDEGGIRLFANKIFLLESYLIDFPQTVKLYLNDTKSLPQISKLINSSGEGKTKIIIIVKTHNNMIVEIALPQAYPLHQALLSQLDTIPSVLKLARK